MIGTVFDYFLIYKDFGKTILKITGENSKKIFENEVGLHQWQRIPPNERRNRTHTSLVAVLLYENNDNKININENDLEISTTRGSGKGGQHRNKTETAVIIKHKKYNITVRCESERSQFQNKQIALELLKAKINKIEKEKLNNQIEENRKNQIGNLNRGSDKKIKIYKEKLNLINDIRTNTKSGLSEWLKGNL